MFKKLLNLFNNKKEVELKYSEVMLVKLHYGWVVINTNPNAEYLVISDVYKTKQEAFDSQPKYIQEMLAKGWCFK